MPEMQSPEEKERHVSSGRTGSSTTRGRKKRQEVKSPLEVEASRDFTPVVAGDQFMKRPAEAGALVMAGGSTGGTPSHAARTVVPGVSLEKVNVFEHGSNREPGEPAVDRLQRDVGKHDDDVCCELLSICQVNRLLLNPFEKLCRHSATFEPCAAQLGVTLLQLLLVSPRDGEKIRVWIGAQCSEASTTPTRVRDLLPLYPFHQRELL